MRRASRGAEERTWARGHSKTRSHSKQKRQDAQADDDDIARTRNEVRAEEEVRDNGRTGGPARSSGSTRCSAHGDGPALKCMAAGGGPERSSLSICSQAGGWIFFRRPANPIPGKGPPGGRDCTGPEDLPPGSAGSAAPPPRWRGGRGPRQERTGQTRFFCGAPEQARTGQDMGLGACSAVPWFAGGRSPPRSGCRSS